MKEGKTLQELAIELDRQKDAKRDLIADLGSLRMELKRPDVVMAVGNVRDHEIFGINDIAHRQIGQHLKIPAQYYDRMRAENPSLLTENVNSWFYLDTFPKRMLRILDGTIRAFLSDRYRRIDNDEIAEAVLPIIGRMEDARVVSCELTERRMYIKVVQPRVSAEVVKGDIVQAGVVISNSEVGLGSVRVSPLIFRLVCSNGMIAEDGAVRKYHVGRANEADENFDIYRSETIEADDKAFLMKLEDSVRAAVDKARFARLVDNLRETTEAKIEAKKAPQVVELTSRAYGFTQEEGEGILGHLIEGGDLSLYGLANAVTRHSKDVESYDRATELEAAGYRLITMPKRQWEQINQD